MSNEQFQNKYNEVVNDLKEEKMNWDFEDFLQKAEDNANNEAEIISINKVKPSFPKWFWMAASVALIFYVGFIFNDYLNSDVENQAKLVENEIQKQKSDFIKENHEHETQVAVLNSDSISGVKNDSIFQENAVAETDVLDEILSKKSRIKKEIKPRYVSNTSVENRQDSTEYKDSYVIVNGKKISNEQEAVDVTKFSMMILGTKFKKTVAASQKNENYNSDY